MKAIKKILKGNKKIDFSILEKSVSRTIQTKEILYVISAGFDDDRLGVKLLPHRLRDASEGGFNLKESSDRLSLFLNDWLNWNNEENNGFKNFYARLFILERVLDDFFDYKSTVFSYGYKDFLSKYNLDFLATMNEECAEIKKIDGILSLKINDAFHTLSFFLSDLKYDQDDKDSIAVLKGIREVVKEFSVKLETFVAANNLDELLHEVKENLMTEENYIQKYILS